MSSSSMLDLLDTDLRDDLGRVDEALPIFRDVFARNADWATLLPRLPKAGLLRDDPEMMRQVLAVAPKAVKSEA